MADFDMNYYVGAYLDEYAGGFSGMWAESVAQILTNLPTLTTIVPASDAAPHLKAFTGTRQKVAPSITNLTITNSPYEASLEIPLDNFRIDTIGIYENQIRELARKARFHWNALTAALITGNGTCADGVAYFATTHPTLDSSGGATTQKNLVVAGDVASLDVATVTAPTDIEMAKILVDLFSYMVGMKDSRGDVVNGDMRSVSVVTGDVAKFSAIAKAVSANVLSDRSDNPVTGLTGYGVKFVPVFEPSLTGASMYMFRNDGVVKPFILGEVTNEPRTLGPDSEYATSNRKVLFAVDAVRGGVVGRYQSALKATLS